MEKCAAWRTFFEFISANTCVYFGKYAHVFPQIFLRISANKFGAGLKKRCFVPSGDSLRFVPDGDMYTSQAGTKVRARRGTFLRTGRRTWACHSCGRGRIYARPQKTRRLVSCILFLLVLLFLCNNKNNRKQDNHEDNSEAHLNKRKDKIVIFFFLVHLYSAIHFAFIFCLNRIQKIEFFLFLYWLDIFCSGEIAAEKPAFRARLYRVAVLVLRAVVLSSMRRRRFSVTVAVFPRSGAGFEIAASGSAVTTAGSAVFDMGASS